MPRPPSAASVAVQSGARVSRSSAFAGTGVTAYSLHPGVVQTDLWRHLSAPEQFFMKIARPFTKNSLQGAQTTIYCAVEPSLDTESGGYYRYAITTVSPRHQAEMLIPVRLSPQRLRRRQLLVCRQRRHRGREAVGSELPDARHNVGVIRSKPPRPSLVWDTSFTQCAAFHGRSVLKTRDCFFMF